MGNLSTPNSVQKLQMALHAKAKAEAGYRFYILYDKISREDILARAYAQCRSNKGAPGIDGQDFADVEAYGVEQWLGELALALKQETYRPDPIRRVFIPKANGKLRPLGISTLRDRVCMTAAMLVLEPIFSAWERCQRYTRALREMLDSPSGEIARGFMGFKTEPLISLIWKRQYSKWIKLEPEDAAICSIATTGASLALGETEYERLAGHAFQLVLINYAEALPRAANHA